MKMMVWFIYTYIHKFVFYVGYDLTSQLMYRIHKNVVIESDKFNKNIYILDVK